MPAIRAIPCLKRRRCLFDCKIRRASCGGTRSLTLDSVATLLSLIILPSKERPTASFPGGHDTDRPLVTPVWGRMREAYSARLSTDKLGCEGLGPPSPRSGPLMGLSLKEGFAPLRAAGTNIAPGEVERPLSRSRRDVENENLGTRCEGRRETRKRCRHGMMFRG